MRLIEDEIKKIANITNLPKNVAILPFFSIIIKYYFIHKLGRIYEESIDRLIKEQFLDFKKYYSSFDREILLDLERVSFDLLNNGEIDLIGNIYDCLVENDLKKVFGQVYTPLPIVKHILHSVGLKDNPKAKICDTSCGAGIFLTEAVKIIINESAKKDNALLEKIISQIYGFDIDKNACILTKLNLLLSTFPLWKAKIIKGDNISLNFNINNTNALTFLPKNIDYIGKFDLVVGNPPFVESKRLPRVDKEICRKYFKDVARGAFDIYICFIKLGINLLDRNGLLGYVLPNKFLVAKYGKSLRQQIIENYAIKEICDISNLNYFNSTNVYPILFVIMKGKLNIPVNIASRFKCKSEFEANNFKYNTVQQSKYKIFDNLYPIFLFETKQDSDIFFNIMENFKTNLSEVINIKTTVSFHLKGLREKYVSKDIDSCNRYKYLGGESYSRKNEVSDFSVEWRRYYINYATDELKKIGNHLPPLSNFLRPKIIFCQHAKRMLAYCDIKGEWVTKDVFPIAYLRNCTDDANRILYYTGLFNSNIFSYIYSLIYRGIQINDGYFHFLPGFLSIMPIPSENNNIFQRVAKIVRNIQCNKVEKELEMKEINDLFYAAYNLKKKDIKRVEEYNKLYLKV